MTEMRPVFMRQISQLTLDAINAEAIRAHSLHGIESMFYGNDEKALRILVEEVGECAKAMNENALGHINDNQLKEQLEKELIQVAAMAATWIERLNHYGAEPGGSTW